MTAGVAGLGCDDDGPGGAIGAFAKRPFLSLGSEIFAIWVSRSRQESAQGLFKETRKGGTGTAGSREAKGDQSSAEDQRLYLSLGQKM